MGNVHSYNKPTVIENAKSQVLNVLPVDVYAFRFTNSDGRVDVSLAFCFGTDTSDGGPGVFVIEPQKLSSLISPALPHIKKEIRKRIQQAKSTEKPNLNDVEDLGDVNVED